MIETKRVSSGWDKPLYRAREARRAGPLASFLNDLFKFQNQINFRKLFITYHWVLLSCHVPLVTAAVVAPVVGVRRLLLLLDAVGSLEVIGGGRRSSSCRRGSWVGLLPLKDGRGRSCQGVAGVVGVAAAAAGPSGQDGHDLAAVTRRPVAEGVELRTAKVWSQKKSFSA